MPATQDTESNFAFVGFDPRRSNTATESSGRVFGTATPTRSVLNVVMAPEISGVGLGSCTVAARFINTQAAFRRGNTPARESKRFEMGE